MTEDITVPPGHTPWGTPDSAKHIAEGIVFYSTPSHGGFWLSPERMASMPDHLRACSFTRDNWFEEDCSWCAVVLAFPECFDPNDRDAAQKTYDAVYAGRLASIQTLQSARRQREPES